MASQDLSEIVARISQYTGRKAINRFKFLAESCPALALVAYGRALEEIVRSTWDISQYQTILASYNRIATSQNLPLMTQDEAWIQNTQAEISRTSNKIEMELKNYTASLIKDSIRMSHRDMATFHRMTGDYNNALRSFTKAREYCTNSFQVGEVSFAVLDMAIDSQNFKLAENYISKAEGAMEAIASSKDNKQDASSKAKTPSNYAGPGTSGSSTAETQEKDHMRSMERLHIATGLTALIQGNYLKAATSFLRVSREAGQYVGAEVVVTTPDLAVYTTLCALATFTRPELKQKVVENVELRSLLEFEPQLKRILNLFVDNKHQEILQFLEDSHSTFRTDLYLAKHILLITHMIQEQAILQYFSPFSSVKLSKAAEAFGWSEARLQERVIQSITHKTLRAKIDVPNGLVLAQQDQPRTTLLRNSIEMSDDMEFGTKMALLRLKLIQADVLVKDDLSGNPPDASRGKPISSTAM